MKRVLYVEDDRDTRESTTLFLEQNGWEVIATDDGRKALQIYHGGEHFDAILLDVLIPGMNGFAVGVNIRNVERFGGAERAIHVYVSGREFVPPEQLKDIQFADAYLLKPANPKELLKALNGE